MWRKGDTLSSNQLSWISGVKKKGKCVMLHILVWVSMHVKSRWIYHRSRLKYSECTQNTIWVSKIFKFTCKRLFTWQPKIWVLRFSSINGPISHEMETTDFLGWLWQWCNHGEIFAMLGRIFPPVWNRFMASENLGATMVALVAPAITSLQYDMTFCSQ